ncbi:MmgE/PrpD-like protein 2 [Elsinoe fawcettii]|nr:MmgE/PrpD-like protein 2 [Elsinoe fawcettii]
MQNTPTSHTSKVLGLDLHLPKQYTAFLNGALAHNPDFDDTHSSGIIHVGATVIAAALSEAQTLPDLTYADLLLATAIGYEVSTRIAIALGISAWHRGFHNTSVAGIYGGVACLAKLRHLTPQQITDAFGLAVSFASGSMQFLENGAWNKRLHPAKAAHDAFVVVALAEAGALGAEDPLEGRYGLVRMHTDAPSAAIDVSDLGRRWEGVNTALKPYPACRATHPVIELAATMAPSRSGKEVRAIRVEMDPSTYPVVAVPSRNKIYAETVVDAQFSAYYQTAVAWLYGDTLGWKVYDHLSDPAVQDLCGRITIDEKQMGSNLETSMEVEWADGSKEKRLLKFPKWEVPHRPPQDEEVMDKFRSLVTGLWGAEEVQDVLQGIFGGLDVRVSSFLNKV